MPITTVNCDALGGRVTLVEDIEGCVVRVICPQLEQPGDICRRRREAANGGPLSRLLERVDQGTLDARTTRCRWR